MSSLMGERIRQMRQNQGCTLKSLGQKINVSEQALSQYELGKREPPLEVVKRISEALDVPTEYLLGLTSFKTQEELTNVSISDNETVKTKIDIELTVSLDDDDIAEIEKYIEFLISKKKPPEEKEHT